MADKRHIAEILAERLQEIDDAGGLEKHQLAELVGERVYHKLMAKQRTADLIDRWVNASSKAKPAATKALSVAIAKASNRPELLDRIQAELSDSFDIPTESRSARAKPAQSAHSVSTDKKTKARKAIDNQRITGQRPVAPDLVALARGSDVSKYIRARRD